MNWELLDPALLGPPLLAGLLVAATHVPLGREVLRRGIVFIDLAIAQVAGLGGLLALRVGLGDHALAPQALALAAALAAAAALGYSERRWPRLQEPLIGSLFVLAASAGVLLLAGDPHGGEHLSTLLAGQILWVDHELLRPVALVYGGVLALWVALPQLRRGAGFYLLFAISVTASVQLVGVYLVFASLILPALAVRRLPGRRAVIAGWLIAAVGYASGLLIAALSDLPPGPLIVWTLAATALAGGRLLSRRS